MSTIGLDIGTSGCKAVRFAADGRQLAAAHRDYDVQFTPDGGAELDADAVIARCFLVIREVADVPGDPVRAIGVSSQGEAFTALDAEGRSLCHAMVSSDTRSEAVIDAFVRDFGEDRLYRITGHTAHPMFTLFKLLWLRENRPQVWEQARWFLCFEDLLSYRFGLDPAMGWPEAGRTMLFDVCEHQWSPDILAAVSIEAEQLARPLPAGSISGRITGDLAAELGLPEGVAVVTGGHDQTCGALGAGVVEPGLAMYATGTVECITPAFAEATFSEALRDSNLCTYDHTAPGMYATVAFSLTGGNILKWFRDEFGQPEVAAATERGRNVYELLLDTADREPSELLVLPYFTPSGTPYFDIQTPGAILGLRLSTTRAEVLRALLEGVAFEMRLNLEILGEAGCEIRELRAIGGGARSPVWTQLKADIIGKPITTLDVTEAGCLGVAMLAEAAVGDRGVAELAREWVHPRDVIAPDPTRSAHYDDRFAKYRQLYPKLRELAL